MHSIAVLYVNGANEVTLISLCAVAFYPFSFSIHDPVRNVYAHISFCSCIWGHSTEPCCRDDPKITSVSDAKLTHMCMPHYVGGHPKKSHITGIQGVGYHRTWLQTDETVFHKLMKPHWHC